MPLMNQNANFFSSLLRGLFKASLMLVTIAFALGALCVALGLIAVTWLRYLFTGRKPTMLAGFTSMNQAAQRFRAGRWPSASAGAAAQEADVVDVQAREVRGQAREVPSLHH